MDVIGGLLWGLLSSYTAYHVVRALWQRLGQSRFGEVSDATQRVVNLFFHTMMPLHAWHTGRLTAGHSAGIFLAALFMLFVILPGRRADS